MQDYIKAIRKIVGPLPLILCGAAVILENERKEILLQKRKDNGLWGYPGGYIEYGEPVELAAARELFEETGLKATNLKFFDLFSGKEMIYTYPNGDEVYVVEHLYLCQKYEGILIPQKNEVSELKFFSKKSFPSFNQVSPLNRPGLKAYLKTYP